MWLGVFVGVVVAVVGVLAFTRTNRKNAPIDGGTVSEGWLAEQRATKDGHGP